MNKRSKTKEQHIINYILIIIIIIAPSSCTKLRMLQLFSSHSFKDFLESIVFLWYQFSFFVLFKKACALTQNISTSKQDVKSCKIQSCKGPLSKFCLLLPERYTKTTNSNFDVNTSPHTFITSTTLMLLLYFCLLFTNFALWNNDFSINTSSNLSTIMYSLCILIFLCCYFGKPISLHQRILHSYTFIYTPTAT